MNQLSAEISNRIILYMVWFFVYARSCYVTAVVSTKKKSSFVYWNFAYWLYLALILTKQKILTRILSKLNSDCLKTELRTMSNRLTLSVELKELLAQTNFAYWDVHENLYLIFGVPHKMEISTSKYCPQSSIEGLFICKFGLHLAQLLAAELSRTKL